MSTKLHLGDQKLTTKRCKARHRLGYHQRGLAGAILVRVCRPQALCVVMDLLMACVALLKEMLMASDHHALLNVPLKAAGGVRLEYVIQCSNIDFK